MQWMYSKSTCYPPTKGEPIMNTQSTTRRMINLAIYALLIAFIAHFAGPAMANFNKASTALTKIQSFGEGPSRVNAAPFY